MRTGSHYSVLHQERDLSSEISKQWHDDTLAVRAGFERSDVGEHAEPIYTTSSYVFASAAEAAARFSGKSPGNVYSRFTNPTVQTFEKRLAAMEGGEACIGTASGMAATSTLIFATLQQGDHMVVSNNLFGSTVNLFGKYPPKFGIDIDFVTGFDIADWERRIRPNTKYLYLETPTNPLMRLADIEAFAELAHAHGAELVVDNCFCTPALQKPLALGADIVVHSATKFLDGQGRCVGGAVVGSASLIEELTAYMRSAGPSMSPFNAWVFSKGLETLALRMKQHSINAMLVATALKSMPGIERVIYPGFPDHPDHELAKRQQRDFGGIVSFEFSGGREAAWALIDAVELCSITGNLGDARTTITHPATTTHGRLTQQQRDESGISEGLIRLAVGLEYPDDIAADIAHALGLSSA